MVPYAAWAIVMTREEFDAGWMPELRRAVEAATPGHYVAGNLDAEVRRVFDLDAMYAKYVDLNKNLFTAPEVPLPSKLGPLTRGLS